MAKICFFNFTFLFGKTSPWANLLHLFSENFNRQRVDVNDSLKRFSCSPLLSSLPLLDDDNKESHSCQLQFLVISTLLFSIYSHRFLPRTKLFCCQQSQCKVATATRDEVGEGVGGVAAVKLCLGLFKINRNKSRKFFFARRASLRN